MMSRSSTSNVRSPGGLPGMRRDRRRRGSARDPHAALLADDHQLQPFGPAGDDLADAERRRLAARDRAVEHLPVRRPARVVDLHVVARRGMVVPVPGASTFVARPDAVFSASAGGAATSGGAGIGSGFSAMGTGSDTGSADADGACLSSDFLMHALPRTSVHTITGASSCARHFARSRARFHVRCTERCWV